MNIVNTSSGLNNNDTGIKSCQDEELLIAMQNELNRQQNSIELIASANLIWTTLSCNLWECCFNSFLIAGVTFWIYSFNEFVLETLLIYALNKDFCG